MSELFGRNIQLVLESVKKETKTFSSKDGFTIEFDVQFGTRAISTVKVYNVLPSTVEMCKSQNPNSKQVKYAKMELSAGYGDDLSLLISADILGVEQRFTSVDRIFFLAAIA